MKAKSKSTQEKKSEKNLENYIDELKRWQSNQYLPGAYLGGDIHPMLRNKTKAGGIFLLFTSIFPLAQAIYVIIHIRNASTYELASNIAGIVLLLTIGTLEIIVGWRFFKRSTASEKTRKRK